MSANIQGQLADKALHLKNSNEQASPQRRAFSIPEFCERNGISRTLAYAEIRSGRLRIRKAGRRSIITTEAEDAWLASLPEPQAA